MDAQVLQQAVVSEVEYLVMLAELLREWAHGTLKGAILSFSCIPLILLNGPRVVLTLCLYSEKRCCAQVDEEAQQE